MSHLSVRNIRHIDRPLAKRLTKSSAKAVPFLTGIYLAFFCQLPSAAEIDARLINPYLQKEFNWAMFIELQDDKPFLRYPGSKLNSITPLRVTYSSFQKETSNKADPAPAQVYEEFWYHEERAIGLRRYRNLNLKTDQIGAIFLGGTGSNTSAAAKVLVRMALELDLQQLGPSLVVVPLDRYDLIVSELRRYSFIPRLFSRSGRQFSIHLRAYPYNKNKDEYFYLQ